MTSESGEQKPMFKFEINLANLIPMLVLFATMVSSYTNLSAQQTYLLERIQTTAIEQRAKNLEFEAELAAAELRTRAVEVNAAGQSSDLRNIQIGINEIKAAVDRLTRSNP